MGSKDKVEAISDFVKLPIIIESDDKFGLCKEVCVNTSSK